MKTKRLIWVSLAMVLIATSSTHGAEPYVIIKNAYTTYDNHQENSEFRVWESVICHIEFKVFGNVDKYYKVFAITKTLGETVQFVTKVPPGDYAMTNIHYVTDQFVPGYTETCEYKIKLKKRRLGVLELKDMDSALSQITIVE
jgi:hypothetical protein